MSPVDNFLENSLVFAIIKYSAHELYGLYCLTMTKLYVSFVLYFEENIL